MVPNAAARPVVYRRQLCPKPHLFQVPGFADQARLERSGLIKLRQRIAVTGYGAFMCLDRQDFGLPVLIP